jgi:outer membrane protein OmpA-like peptidoglycan-associated protein
MLKKIHFMGMMISVFIIMLFSSTSYPQFNDYGSKIGVQLNGLLPDTEFEKEFKVSSSDYKFSYLGRLFYRFEIIKQLIETELGAGYGTLAGVDFTNAEYKTEIIPFDLRLILSPFNIKAFNPYAYAGIGIMHYAVKTLPLTPSPKPAKDQEWSPFAPVGGGFEIALSDNIVLDLSGGYTFAFTDNLNYYNNLDSYSGVSTVYDGYYSAALGLILVRGGGNTDKDMDGLLKKEEKELGTDPENPDSDGDGLKDGEEVNKYNSNPLNADTDGDGLKDGEEVNKYGTNPVLADTDGDGLNDGTEVNLHKTNPTKADTDGDGLNDNEEITKFKTDPLKADTDGEGLNDGDEVKKYKTDPLKTDTDSDGLYDGEEVMKHKTDPLKKDTDGGTVDDLTELTRGTNPLDANDDVVKIGVPIVLEGVTFESNKADITPESSQILRTALKTLTTYPEIQVEISGHTDNVGSKKANTKLSQRRADSVRSWLIERGIDPGRIVAKGYGPDVPIVPNDSPDNKRKNRRIEFKRIK